MVFADLALSRRLERAEGRACVRFAEARRRLFPESRAEWMECAGAYAVFDRIDSPVTQTFGLGIFEEPTASSLDVIERFFFDRGEQALPRSESARGKRGAGLALYPRVQAD